jgi:hypothetical protein
MTQPTPAAAPATPAADAPATPANPTQTETQTPTQTPDPKSTSLLPENPPVESAPTTPAPKEPTAPVDPNSPDAWVLAEGVLGQGEKPEWFKSDKYASVADQAKAYADLEKRFGTFTGAPKDGNYDLTLPEGVGVELAPEHPLLDQFKAWAKDNQLSQKGFTELLGYLAQYEAQHFIDMDAVKSELGENADARIAAVASWGKANLDAEGFEALREATSGPQAAAAFKAFEAIINKTRQVALPKPGADVPAAGAAAHAELEKLMAEKLPDGKLRYFHDPKFRAEVEAKRLELFKQ